MFKPGNPQRPEETVFAPEPEITVYRAWGAKRFWQCFPLNTGTEKVKNCLKSPA
jgi:hypothetical protein